MKQTHCIQSLYVILLPCYQMSGQVDYRISHEGFLSTNSSVPEIVNRFQHVQMSFYFSYQVVLRIISELHFLIRQFHSFGAGISYIVAENTIQPFMFFLLLIQSTTDKYSTNLFKFNMISMHLIGCNS